MKRTLLSMSLLAINFASLAQLSPVMDIRSGTDASSPSRLTVFKNKLVFFATDGNVAPGNGYELWSLDTAGVLELIYNIGPGTASSNFASDNIRIAIAAGRLIFPANDGTNGNELYSWDGVNAPVLAKDINPAAGTGSNPADLVALNNKVYFAANNGTAGNELWEYDPVYGTARMLKDINPLGSSNPVNLMVYNGKLYFSAFETTAGTELYVYDPATDETEIAADIYPGANGSTPQSMVLVAGRMYFTATESVYGRELYSITNTTVKRHTDLNLNNGNSLNTASTNQKLIGTLNNMVYFSGNTSSTSPQLFKFDPKTEMTSLVYDINPLGSATPISFTPFNNKLYFSARTEQYGRELWSYDGMNAPMMVADIDTGVGNSNPGNFTVFNNTLYFTATEPQTGTELYKYTDASLGIQNVRFDADIKLYPNPATSEAYLEMQLKQSGQLSVQLFDIMGRVVFATGMQRYDAGNVKLTLPLGTGAAGTYTCKITGADGRNYYSGKLTKQ